MVNKLLITKEIAKILRVSDKSVDHHTGYSQLQASRIGQWRIRQKDSERFLKKNLNIKKR